jgi:hypothetical protein
LTRASRVGALVVRCAQNPLDCVSLDAARRRQAASNASKVVWVKRMDVLGAQYVAVKGVDAQQLVDDFKTRYVAEEKLDVRPSLVTLRLARSDSRKPTAEEEAAAVELDDPSLTLAAAGVTGTAWMLAKVAGACYPTLWHVRLPPRLRVQRVGVVLPTRHVRVAEARRGVRSRARGGCCARFVRLSPRACSLHSHVTRGRPLLQMRRCRLRWNGCHKSRSAFLASPCRFWAR